MRGSFEIGGVTKRCSVGESDRESDVLVLEDVVEHEQLYSQGVIMVGLLGRVKGGGGGGAVVGGGENRENLMYLSYNRLDAFTGWLID